MQTEQAENGKIVVARVNNKIIVRRYYRNADQIELRAENAEHAPIILNATTQPFAIEGIGVGVIRTNGL